MEEFIKQKRNEGFSEKVAREFYIDMKEERDRQNRIDKEERDRQDKERERQDRINKEERDRQDRIDKEEKERQDKEKDRQERIEREEREHQYKMLELQARMTVGSNRNEEINLPSRTEKMLMPNFSEEKDNIDAYLERFERIAEINGLDIACWAFKLSTLLTGKATEVYTKLSKEDANDYNKLKEVLLRRYNMNENGYRLKFYECKPNMEEDPTQYIERIKGYLIKWVELSKTEKTYEGMVELFVIEQFLQSCPKALNIFLQERNIKTIEQITIEAENYLRAHECKLAQNTQEKKKTYGREEKDSKEYKDPLTQKCIACNKVGHRAIECRLNEKFNKPRYNHNRMPQREERNQYNRYNDRYNDRGKNNHTACLLKKNDESLCLGNDRKYQIEEKSIIRKIDY